MGDHSTDATTSSLDGSNRGTYYSDKDSQFQLDLQSALEISRTNNRQRSSSSSPSDAVPPIDPTTSYVSPFGIDHAVGTLGRAGMDLAKGNAWTGLSAGLLLRYDPFPPQWLSHV